MLLLERDDFTWKLAAIPAGSGWRYWSSVFHPLWPVVMHAPKQPGWTAAAALVAALAEADQQYQVNILEGSVSRKHDQRFVYRAGKNLPIYLELTR